MRRRRPCLVCTRRRGNTVRYRGREDGFYVTAACCCGRMAERDMTPPNEQEVPPKRRQSRDGKKMRSGRQRYNVNMMLRIMMTRTGPEGKNEVVLLLLPCVRYTLFQKEYYTDYFRRSTVFASYRTKKKAVTSQATQDKNINVL